MRRVTLVVVVLALAGCGGGDGGPRLSRDAFIVKANALCAKVEAQQKALAAPTTLAEIPGYVDTALPILDAGVNELRALRPPENMQEGVDDWLATTDETRNVLRSLKKAALANDAAAARAAGSEGQAVDDRRDAQARALGLTACANT